MRLKNSYLSNLGTANGSSIHLDLSPPAAVRCRAARLPAEDGERAHGRLGAVQLRDGLKALGRVRVHRDPVLLPRWLHINRGGSGDSDNHSLNKVS